jgi:hypothetical protein
MIGHAGLAGPFAQRARYYRIDLCLIGVIRDQHAYPCAVVIELELRVLELVSRRVDGFKTQLLLRPVRVGLLVYRLDDLVQAVEQALSRLRIEILRLGGQQCVELLAESCPCVFPFLLLRAPPAVEREQARGEARLTGLELTL